MVAKYPKVLLRKVDIVKWESDAWKQASGEFRAEGIPLLAVFDGKGKFHGTVPADLARIDALLRRALIE